MLYLRWEIFYINISSIMECHRFYSTKYNILSYEQKDTMCDKVLDYHKLQYQLILLYTVHKFHRRTHCHTYFNTKSSHSRNKNIRFGHLLHGFMAQHIATKIQLESIMYYAYSNSTCKM